MKLFDNDFWDEVLQTIMQQKSRSIMTAFGVFWGIFMLVILVAVGIGMDNGIVASYTSLPQNSLFMYSNPTSKPYQGLAAGRVWWQTNSDLQAIKDAFPDAVTHAVGLTQCNNGVPMAVAYNEHTVHYPMWGVPPEYINTVPHKVVCGRHINSTDMTEHRNVCVLGENVSQMLFGDQNPLGKVVSISAKAYTVVGVVAKSNNRIKVGIDTPNSVMLPLTVLQETFNLQEAVHISIFVIKDELSAEAYQKRICAILKERHNINPADTEAIWDCNLKEYSQKFLSLRTGIYLLIWIVGLGTLLAGLIGISNIMIITISERTKEIGIRRALGALPENIIIQILCESLVLTIIAGIAGLAAGVYLIAMVARLLPPASRGGVIANPYMPVIPALCALAVLIVGGLIAGWIPARRALAVKPIEALRED